jgi:hypothetical protein
VLGANGAGAVVKAEAVAWDRMASNLAELRAKMELAAAESEEEYEQAGRGVRTNA